jgi:hypothetical protein
MLNPESSNRNVRCEMWLSEESFKQVLCNAFFVSAHMNFDPEEEMKKLTESSKIDFIGKLKLTNHGCK